MQQLGCPGTRAFLVTVIWTVIFHGWDPRGKEKTFSSRDVHGNPGFVSFKCFHHQLRADEKQWCGSWNLCRRGTNAHSTPWSTRMPQTSSLGSAAEKLLPFPAKTMEWSGNFWLERPLCSHWDWSSANSVHGITPLLPVSANLDLFRAGTCFSPAWRRWHLGVWHLGGWEISMPLGNNRAEGRRRFVWKKKKKKCSRASVVFKSLQKVQCKDLKPM